MHTTTRNGLLALVAILLICGLPFFTRAWFDHHETASRPPLPAASRVPAAEAVVFSASPTPEQPENDAQEVRRKRLQLESRQLKQANATLESVRQQAEADKKRAEQTAQSMAALTGKLLDPALKVPHTASEAGSLAGQNLVDTANFKKKWGDSVPAAGTPEADEYAREHDALVGESAALLKFMTDQQNAARLAQPDGIAQFQTASLAGALTLRADQTQGINTALEGYYQQFFAQGLNSASQPQTGVDAWQAQRAALSQQSYTAVSSFLTSEQAATFRNIYPAARSWLLIANMGAVPGLDGMY